MGAQVGTKARINDAKSAMIGTMLMAYGYWHLMKESRVKKPSLTVLEIYEDAYKTATGEGEHNKGAHYRGLEAVYQTALRRVHTRPFRSMVYRWARRLEEKLRP